MAAFPWPSSPWGVFAFTENQKIAFGHIEKLFSVTTYPCLSLKQDRGSPLSTVLVLDPRPWSGKTHTIIKTPHSWVFVLRFVLLFVIFVTFCVHLLFLRLLRRSTKKAKQSPSRMVRQYNKLG
jgi:hypothetical protein